MKSTAAVVASRGAALTIEQFDLDEPAPNEIAVRATKLAGFGQLSLHPHETRDTIKGGLRPGDMLEIAAENDVAITRLDPLSNWNPRWLPTNMDASYVDDFDIEATEFFELCEQLGIKYCSLNATFADDIYTGHGRTASGES